MFVTVKYGDDQSKIFNANCRNDILLHSIKEKCKCKYDDIVELSDERGVVKDLRRHPFGYGVDLLKERETLILLKVEGPHTGNENNQSRIIYTPLLAGLENDQEFVETLNPKMESHHSRPISARSGVNISDEQKNVKNTKNQKQSKKSDRKNAAKSPKHK